MRGRRPTTTIGKAKIFCKRQGYRWVPNPEPAIPFDAFGYRDNDIIAIRIRTSRNAPGEYDLSEEFFREDYKILRALPLPGYVSRELWVRYSWSRVFRRFRLIGELLWETWMIDRDQPVYPCRRPESLDADAGDAGIPEEK